MTTFDTIPTVRESLQVRLATVLINRAKRSNHTRAVQRTSGSLVNQIFKVILHLAGFACLTIAGFTINNTAGFITAGIALFLFAAIATPDTPSEPTQRG